MDEEDMIGRKSGNGSNDYRGSFPPAEEDRILHLDPEEVEEIEVQAPFAVKQKQQLRQNESSPARQQKSPAAVQAKAAKKSKEPKEGENPKKNKGKKNGNHSQNQKNNKVQQTKANDAKKQISLKQKQEERDFMKRKQSRQRQGKKASRVWIWAIVALLVLGAAFYLYWKNVPTQQKVLALVNGEPIFDQDIQEQAAKLPLNIRGLVSQEQLLQDTIGEVLLLQEAQRQNITVNKEDAGAAFTRFMQERGLSEQDVESILSTQSISREYLTGMIMKQLIISELLNRTVISSIEVSQAEMEEYYIEHPELYTTPVKVKVRHILVLVNEQRTDEEAKALIEQIAAEATFSNFCDYVTNYSEDAVSIFNCGTYNYDETTEFDPDFKQAGLDLEPGTSTIVRSQYGYHLIQSLAKAYATKKLFIEVREEMKQGAFNEKAKAAYQEYMTELESNADIINYLENPELKQPRLADVKVQSWREPAQTPEGTVTAQDTQNGEETTEADGETWKGGEATTSTSVNIMPVAPAEAEKEATLEEQASQEEASALAAEEEGEQTAEPVEETAAPTAPVEPQEPEKTPEEFEQERTTAMDTFAKCLTYKGAKMYGAYWCGYCNKQKELFGESFQHVTYIECANADMPEQIRDQCLADQITAYPTWVIDSYQYKTALSLEKLASLSGCSLP